MKYLLPAIFLTIVYVSCGEKGGGDDEPSNRPDPTMSIQDLTQNEGNGASTGFNVVVRLSSASDKQITVNYTTSDGFARSGEDYTGVSAQTLTFMPNETQKNITVSVMGDDLKEGDDEFRISLSTPVNAKLGDAIGLVTIRNDDTRVGFTNAGYDAPTSYAGYTLAWSDEFNGTSLNTTDWSHQNGDGCPGVCGWGNNELEYYTDRPENIFFQDGKLIIEARKEAFSGKNYTSSKILTAGKKAVKFGRIDMRAKLPTGKGIWPAFWMLPEAPQTGWPTSGEIDIMEMVGHQPNTLVGTLHYGPGPGSIQYSRNTVLPTGSLHDEFHVYSVEWKEDEFRWFLDGVQYSSVTRAGLNQSATYPFNEPFYFILNLAVGGNWPGSPNDETYFPQWYIVDYVRVYQ